MAVAGLPAILQCSPLRLSSRQSATRTDSWTLLRQTRSLESLFTTHRHRLQFHKLWPERAAYSGVWLQSAFVIFWTICHYQSPPETKYKYSICLDRSYRKTSELCAWHIVERHRSAAPPNAGVEDSRRTRSLFAGWFRVVRRPYLSGFGVGPHFRKCVAAQRL